MDKKSKVFWIGILCAFLLVAGIAFYDVLSKDSGVFGTPEDYENGNYTEGWWNLFWIGSIGYFVTFGLFYYLLVRRDFSEALSLPLTSYIVWMFGLADVLYFWFQGRIVPETLPWLSNNIFINFFTTVTQTTVVTATTLYISTTIGILLALGGAWTLRKHF